MLIKNYIKLTSEEMYAIWWHMGFTDQHTDTMSLAAAIQKYPIVWALHTADMMASNFMEDKDGNKRTSSGRNSVPRIPATAQVSTPTTRLCPAIATSLCSWRPHHADRRS